MQVFINSTKSILNLYIIFLVVMSLVVVPPCTSLSPCHFLSLLSPMSLFVTNSGYPLPPTLVASFLHLKILTPKQNLQRLPVAPAHVETGNTSENLLMKSVKSYILCVWYFYLK